MDTDAPLKNGFKYKVPNITGQVFMKILSVKHTQKYKSTWRGKLCDSMGYK